MAHENKNDYFKVNKITGCGIDGCNFFYLVEPAPSKPKYRPFKDCDELIETFRNKIEQKYRVIHCENSLELPTIWVKNKVANIKRLITFIDDEGVGNNMDFFKYDYLFEYYTFLDGSVCGVEE